MNRVMITDDESIVSKHLMEHLTSIGYDVVGYSSSGKDAVDMARSLYPDIVLMDIVMPGELDGIDAADIIKSEMDIPVIFITAYVDDELVKKAMNVEPFGYVLKPVNERELEATIEIALYRKEMERRLKRSEDRYRSFLDNLGDAAYEADLNGNITYANRMCEIVSGIPLKEIIGKPFLPAFTDKSQKKAIEVFQRTLNGEDPEYELTFNNGRIFHFKNEPLRDDVGRIVGVFGIARDVTEQRRVEEALQREHDELELKVKERTAELYVRNEELEKEISERRQAEALLKIQHDLSIALGSTSNLKWAMDLLLETICRIEGIDCGNVYLVNRETGEAEQVSHIGLSPQFVESASIFPLDSPQVKLMESGKPVYGTHSELAPFADEVRKQEGIRATASIPVHCDGEIIAYINMGSHTVNDLPEIIRNAIETIASEMGEVITRIRLGDELLQILIGRLSPREIELLKCLSKGCGRKDISRRMYITESTYDTYFRNIRKKLNLKERNEVIRFALNYKDRLS
jgi:PAS domain S-box-containing protein